MLHVLRRYTPPNGIRLLLALLCGATIAAAWVTPALTVLPLAAPGSDLFHPVSLITNGFVAPPVGPGGLVLILALIAWFNQDALRFMWRRAPQRVLAWTLGPLIALFVADRWLIPGHAFGLAMDALTLIWFGATVERRWGQSRTLWFAAIVAIGANGVAALVVWAFPGSLKALAAPAAAAPIGAGALSLGLLTVWCLMQGDRILPIINAPARKLLIAIAILQGIEVIFVGVASAIYDLSGIGIAILLVTGRWHPSKWRQTPRPRLVRDDRDHYHRGRATPTPDLCSSDLAYDTVVRGAAEGWMMGSGRAS